VVSTRVCQNTILDLEITRLYLFTLSHHHTTITPSMLHDITAQTVQTNTKSIPCILPKSTKNTKTEKRVTFDVKGTTCIVEILITAMAAEKQKARLYPEPRTPSKPKEPDRPLIGSSSTWRNDQLDRFMVDQKMLDVKAMIPEKWFDFGQFDNYQARFNFQDTELTVVRDQITSVRADELSDSRTIHQKAPDFLSVLRAAHELRDLAVTEVRLDNFAEKRQEKRSSRPIGPPTSAVIPEWVGPSLPPLTTEEICRIASISDPSKSSAGSRLFYATQEKDSEMLATQFCKTMITFLFWEKPSLKWVTGRDKGKPVLRWRHRLKSPVQF
jgi:hypothetical protein